MKLAIQICSEHEWETTRSILQVAKDKLRNQPFGDYFKDQIGRAEGIFYHSGATKTKAAAACQFAIDTWHPDAIANFGTCGGVGEKVKKL